MNQEEIYWVQKEGSTMENKKKVLLKIFISTLYLSAFTFGGG